MNLRLWAVLRTLLSLLQSHRSLALENLALRQQLANLKATTPRPTIKAWDRAFWITLSQLWSGWKDVLHVVRPETVVRWHREGFRWFWAWRSRRSCRGHRRHDEVRALVRRMAQENPTWGAPRIHAELLKLGFEVSERSVSRWLPKRSPTEKARANWRTFLANHRDCLAAMDFFTVPTASFQVLYVWFCIDHARRKILHFNVTGHPTSAWVIQQLRECWPFDAGTPRCLLSDRDSIFGAQVTDALAGMCVEHKRISYKSPWQNGVAERWIGSVRRELFDHVIVLNEAHLRRLLREYVDYYNRDRTHLTLEKDCPEVRAVSERGEGTLVAFPRVGGLHHRYEWRRAA